MYGSGSVAGAFFQYGKRKNMYNDLFSIGPFTVHSYGLFMAIGIIAAITLASARAKRHNLSEDIFYGILFCASIFGLGGAKLMYIIVEFDDFLKSPKEFLSSSGFVVYGGITLGFAAVIVYCLIKKVDVLTYLDYGIPAVALAQGFGRIGCFMAGCCYGRVTDSWFGIAFTHSDFAPNNVKLIPTQLISAGGDFLNCLILILISRKVKKKGVICSLYVLFYSVGRFMIEFLRNDDRGAVGSLSTSQFYGIFAAIIGICLLIFFSLRKEKPVEAEAAEE